MGFPIPSNTAMLAVQKYPSIRLTVFPDDMPQLCVQIPLWGADFDNMRDEVIGLAYEARFTEALRKLFKGLEEISAGVEI